VQEPMHWDDTAAVGVSESRMEHVHETVAVGPLFRIMLTVVVFLMGRSNVRYRTGENFVFALRFSFLPTAVRIDTLLPRIRHEPIQYVDDGSIACGTDRVGSHRV
jgi:hypothetical protein